MANHNYKNDENNSDEDEDLLTFSLSCGGSRKRPARDSPPTTQGALVRVLCTPSDDAPPPAKSNLCIRRRRGGSASGVKSETIPPPFPWATDRRATVHRLDYLLENGIHAIKGKVECKRCKNKFEMVLDLKYNLRQLLKFIDKELEKMHKRAHEVWMRPDLPKCEHCGQENSVQPSFENTKKKNINWLFLLLGQTLGCCTLAQIKYFLKHNNLHRTGSKEHVLYDSYLCLCKQLNIIDPNTT
ncbi:uncharacterized protein LOC114188602 [Vigna unguiculata]|uniref:DUF7086 domain-containing protein n=1 Tax=Vigna unguiculata TaxID=3917 RepID=A0A4D6KIL5_VIGUN|nr:uncharacterized protein LOC114188602 [Vigna unguiculata]QCD77111.1 hypothetical protein DEO72_LG1g733 [Vigna unguiculata]QCD77112.1 hypothetical protein DEO72_LG1g734 [Vigna unguiculata]